MTSKSTLHYFYFRYIYYFFG